jgi:hypothetical protein
MMQLQNAPNAYDYPAACEEDGSMGGQRSHESRGRDALAP